MTLYAPGPIRPTGLFRLSAIVWIAAASSAWSDVIVIANRTAKRIEAHVAPRRGRPYRVEIAGGAVTPIYCEGSASISVVNNGPSRRHQLDANSAYYFGRTTNGSIVLQKIGLGGDKSSWVGRRLPGDTDAVGTIGVTIAVDEEEPAIKRIWEARLRKRVEKASDILEQHCRIRLKIVRTTTWDSDDRTTDFLKTLLEFEKEVDPLPGRLAIGFTSQYHVPRGRTHLGGTRGPLFSHIVIREWSKHVGEPERLELLLHELGHHLGAAHSAEVDSVMRPLLGDRQSVRAGFVIKFDPVNMLAMNLVAEEVRRRGIRQMVELSAGSKRRLRQIYGVLAKADSDGKSPRLYRQLMNQMQRRNP